MRHQIHRLVLIGIALIIPALGLFGLFPVMRHIATGLMAPHGDIARVAATYSLGLYVLVFPVCLLCLLAWTLLHRPSTRNRPPRAAGIILRMHYAACVLFATTTYLAFR